MSGPYLKDPDERLDYTEDWSDYLVSAETISSVAYTVPSGLTNYNTSNTATTATIWLSGGTHGEEYLVGIKITTSAGRIAERSFKLLCRNR
jgi:hypothetical protein